MTSGPLVAIVCTKKGPRPMLKRIVETIGAKIQSHKYASILNGEAITLPSGKKEKLTIIRTVKSIRPLGYKLAPFSFHTEIKVDGSDRIFSGFGESYSELLSLQKSISEAVERSMMFLLKRDGVNVGHSTSGWAVHPNEAQSKMASFYELLERDSILTHWLTKTPMNELDQSAYPLWLKKWCRKELSKAPRWNQLRVLLSTEGFAPSVTTVLLDKDGFGVCSHAANQNISNSLYSALTETCRIAQIATEESIKENRFFKLNQKFSHEILVTDHIFHHAFYEPFPNWIFGKKINKLPKNKSNYQELLKLVQFETYKCGDLFVSHCKSESLQSLYFGFTEEAQQLGLLNMKRLKAVKNFEEINFAPHIVA